MDVKALKPRGVPLCLVLRDRIIQQQTQQKSVTIEKAMVAFMGSPSQASAPIALCNSAHRSDSLLPSSGSGSSLRFAWCNFLLDSLLSS